MAGRGKTGRPPKDAPKSDCGEYAKMAWGGCLGTMWALLEVPIMTAETLVCLATGPGVIICSAASIIDTNTALAESGVLGWYTATSAGICLGVAKRVYGRCSGS